MRLFKLLDENWLFIHKKIIEKNYQGLQKNFQKIFIKKN